VRRLRLRVLAASAVFVVLSAVGAALVLAAGRTHSGDGTVRTAAEASTSCSAKLLADWSDGRIDGTYPIRCYRRALESLPSDLKVYSSAPDDIAQALSQRIVQSRGQKISGHQGATSVRKLASARDTAPARSSATRPARPRSRNVNPPR
jgi:hypothetical protein